jgi:serine/threonine-protein kinase
MGEVYRAEDLRLGLPVALKFLPAELERDEGRRQRFLNEAKVGLKVTHPNVCRVYDLGEMDGHHFLAMEYIDGEDLASLLRRIGRLPADKAVQIARQLCSGLAAAHEQGVLHRDLKPANVMVDGRGRARITDFGLASLVSELEGDEVRAGTPAYMSPEQLQGDEITTRSDLYSLGLVLYELFTGKPAHFASSTAELAKLRLESVPTNPSSHVKNLDPAVERVVLRCLEKEASQRPSSALQVAAALPGGDPLAAALAAGETPSPGMVADAGEVGGLQPSAAWYWLLLSVCCLVLSLFMGERLSLAHWAPLGLPPEVLAERAREIAGDLGYTDPPRDAEYGFLVETAYLDHIEKTNDSPDRWEVLRTGRPPAWLFWYRQSPRPLVPLLDARAARLYDDPPFVFSGTVGIHLDPTGRLIRLDAVPPQRDEVSVEAGTPDWSTLFDAAGFQMQDFTEATPTWSPLTFADDRRAWKGVDPEASGALIRIEAASFRERPVSFRIIHEWTPLDRMETPQHDIGDTAVAISYAALPMLSFLGASFLAWRNLRLGRSHREGAFRLAMYFLVIRLLVWLFSADDILSSTGPNTFFSHLAWALYRFGLVWLFYIALEPYLRRIWPRTMVSWARMLEGRFRDPLVGRDVLFGVGIWAALLVTIRAIPLLAERLGTPLGTITPDASALPALTGLPDTIWSLLYFHAEYLLNAGLFMVVFLLVLRVFLRKTWIALPVWTVAIVLLTEPFEGDSWMIGVTVSLMIAAWWLVTFFRVGLLSLMVALGLAGLLLPVTETTNLGAWHSTGTLLFALVSFALALYGFHTALAGRPMFRDVIPDG